MPKPIPDGAEYRLYPEKDKMETRNLRVDLAYEKGAWRRLGEKGPISSEEYKAYRDGLESGRAEIKKVVGSVERPDGKEDFVENPPSGPFAEDAK